MVSFKHDDSLKSSTMTRAQTGFVKLAYWCKKSLMFSFFSYLKWSHLFLTFNRGWCSWNLTRMSRPSEWTDVTQLCWGWILPHLAANMSHKIGSSDCESLLWYVLCLIQTTLYSKKHLKEQLHACFLIKSLTFSATHDATRAQQHGRCLELKYKTK